jgi:hypothetical protein
MKKITSFTFILLFISVASFSQTKKPVTKKTTTTVKTQKVYITMCGDKYEKGTNFESMLPSDWEESVGLYCLRNYKEGVSTVSVTGANSKGIMIKAIGEETGSAHLVLYTCDGQLF